MTYTIEIIDNNYLVFKPVNEMSNTEYDNIKPLIEMAGGHWREKYKGFMFKADTSHRIKYSEEKEKTQFFPTPDTVIKRMVELSKLKGIHKDSTQKILEPSAGRGAILDAIKKECNTNIYALEPDKTNLKCLYEKGYYMARQTTFEDWAEHNEKEKNTFDYILMNPPFSGSRDVLHTMLAYEFLKESGTLVAVISENALYYANEHSDKFRKWLKDVNAYIEEIPYGAFRESGTLVDTVIVKVEKWRII